jgi:hypothetical protein
MGEVVVVEEMGRPTDQRYRLTMKLTGPAGGEVVGGEV